LQSLVYFKDTGFFQEIKLYEPETGQYYLNLNYYRNLTDKGKLLHAQRKGYRMDFELLFKTTYQREVVLKKLSLLDFIILDRVRNISFMGFGFERRESTLKELKSDLVNEISAQKMILESVRNVLDRFSESPNLKKRALYFLKNNKKYGFFTFKEYVEQTIELLKLAIEILNKNPLITNPAIFNEFIKKNGISMLLQETLSLNNERARKVLLRELVPLYFEDRNLFKEEYQALSQIKDFLMICYQLKIFSLNSMKSMLENPSILTNICRIKEEKLDIIYKESQLRNITSVEVENRLEDFSTSQPPIISPKMIDSMIGVLNSTISFILVAKNSPRVLRFLEELSHIVPHYTHYKLNEINDEQKVIFCRFGMQGMDMKEKYEFYSIIHNHLKEDLFSFSRYIHQGFYSTFSRRSYYDFMEGTFFYTPDLYSEFRKYIRNTFGKNFTPITIHTPKNFRLFWLNKTNLVSFIDDMNQKRMVVSQEFNKNQLDQLVDFNKNLRSYLLNGINYQAVRETPFFGQFIQSIRIKPILPEFGLQKYYLYFQAQNFNDIVPELLLINTFLSMRFNSTRFDTYSFLVKYIFPYNTPSKKYINWQLFSKKNFNEYCLFSVTKTYEILHFSKHLTLDGWRMDYDSFMQHVQKALFDPSFTPRNASFKTLNFMKTQLASYMPPNAPNFIDLLTIFDKKSAIKSFWGTKRGAQLEQVVTRLLNNNLVHPSLKLKNLQLRECLFFIIPNLNENQINILKKVFQFFNVVTINEITGEYYLPSQPLRSREEELITFDQGLMIKISMPDIEISPFVDTIFDVLEYLHVDHYIFFSELFKTKEWLAEVFKGVDLESDYNPLLNLEWNDFDKIYMNHKLFGENFTPQYPKLNRED